MAPGAWRLRAASVPSTPRSLAVRLCAWVAPWVVAGALWPTLAAAGPDPDPRAGGIPLGLGATIRNRTGADLDATIARLRAAGIGWTREDLEWQSIEPAPGEFTWAATDAWMAAAARQGLQVVGIANTVPAWMSADPSVPPISPHQRSLFGRFVFNLVRRYGSTGSFWAEHPELPRVPLAHLEIWNEPYVEQFWNVGPTLYPDPRQYARLLTTAVRYGRRAGDPNMRFMASVSGELADRRFPKGRSYMAEVLRALPADELLFDEISLHPYSGDPRTCSGARRYQFCRVGDAARLLAARGLEDVPIWVTEIGWPTAPAAPGSVAEQTQADYVHATFELARRWPEVRGLLFYTYQTVESDPADREDWFGFVHLDGTAKPAWDALVEEVQRGVP